MSKTYLAAIVSFLGFIAQLFHTQLPYSEGEIVNALSIVVALAGFLWTIYERIKKGGITWYGKSDPSIPAVEPPIGATPPSDFTDPKVEETGSKE